jgi:CRP/FNR family transcriptional regulator, cyclic AMP receptor protein
MLDDVAVVAPPVSTNEVGWCLSLLLLLESGKSRPTGPCLFLRKCCARSALDGLMLASPMATEVQSHSFLKGLSAQQLETLSKIATRAQFKAGKPIFHQRETADRFYLIEQGHVSLDYGLPRKRHVQIQTIGPGEALGWSWLAEPYQWQFSATAIDDVTVSAFRVPDLREQCARDPKLGYAIMERIAQVLVGRLQATRHKLLVYVQRAGGDEDTQQVC